MVLNYKNTIGYGALIWIIIFVFVSALIGFKLYYMPGVEIIVALAGGIMAYIMAGYAKPKNTVQALVFGLSWAVVGIILDALITMQFNANIFNGPQMWLNYLLGVVVPTLRVKKN